MLFKVNGLDITPYIAHGGIKWSRNDLDGPNAGRTLDGTMFRDRVGIKYRWDITCRPLLQSEFATLMQALQPEFFNLQYVDPITLETVTEEYYSNDIPAEYELVNLGKEVRVMGVTFPVIQR